MVRLEELRHTLDGFLEKADAQEFAKWLEDVHPADLALLLNEYSPEIRARIFQNLTNPETQQEVLMFVEGHIKSELFSLLDESKKISYMEEMPPDEAADLIEEVADIKVDELLSGMDPKKAEEVRGLRKYEQGTAGALMTTSFIQVKAHAKIQDVIRILATEKHLESIDTGYVLTDAGKILGAFDVQELLVHKGNPFVVQFVDEDAISIEDTASEELAYKLMTRHGLDILPVVSHNGTMVGIITADDMLEVARDISDQDFYQMVGTSGDPSQRNVIERAFSRIPWLFVTLVGAGIAGLILRFFDMELKHFSLLVAFVPGVIAMAGNVGVQSATIIVRELVNQESTDTGLKKDIFREMGTGLLNACFFGLTAALLVNTYSYFADLGTMIAGPAIGVALFCSMSIAGVIGANIPILFAKLKIDPAISSGPIITMTMDVIGLSIYLSVATWIFHLGGLTQLHF